MNDPRLEGTRIQRVTGCRIGAHSFTFTGQAPTLDLRCSCGAYTLGDWITLQAEPLLEGMK